MEMDTGSDMESLPGMAQGMYMWTAGPYEIEPDQEYKLSFIVGANAKGEEEIKFRITTNKRWFPTKKGLTFCRTLCAKTD